MKTKILTLALVAIFLLSCNKEDVAPIVNNPTFSTIMLASEVPSDVGSNIQDAIMLDDGSMLIIIDGALYANLNNNFTQKISSAIYLVALQKTNDGNIYVLGEDVIYISTDNGNTFTEQRNFVAQQGQSYALDLYYNGKPNNMLVKKLPDGSFVMWLYTEYNYSLGGTGFTQLRYLHFVFTSSNGLDWSINEDAGAEITSHPTAIDNNGTVYISDLQGGGGQTSENHFYYTSTDFGVTKTENINGSANAVSKSNALYYINRITIDTRFESLFQQWNGENWEELNPIIDDKAKSANASQLIVSKVSFTPDGKMLLINPHGIYQSDITF